MTRPFVESLLLLILLGGCTADVPEHSETGEEAVEIVSGETLTPEEFWSRDRELDRALSASHEITISTEIQQRLAEGIERMMEADGSVDQAQAETLVQAMRWAAIRQQASTLPQLDRIANAPRGLTERRLHDGLVYTARWAAWRIKSAELTAEERVTQLIADWRVQGAGTAFAEHRLVDIPGAGAALIALAVDELLPAAGHFEEGVLVVDDLASADLLSRVMTILEVRGERNESEMATIQSALEGTGLEF